MAYLVMVAGGVVAIASTMVMIGCGMIFAFGPSERLYLNPKYGKGIRSVPPPNPHILTQEGKQLLKIMDWSGSLALTGLGIGLFGGLFT